MDLTTRVCQIFEYLLAVNRLSETIIRRVEQYEKIWWQRNLPNFDGCFLKGSGKYKDAWLEVHKQSIPSIPTLPRVLDRWVTSWDDPEKEPIIKERYNKIVNLNSYGTKNNADEDHSNFENFWDDCKRVNVFEEWVKNVWRPWAKIASPKNKIQKLYTDFFALHQRLQREGDDVELAWGHGLLSWKIDGHLIKRPLLITPLELQFDAKKGIFLLYPTSKGTFMETDMLDNIQLPYAKKLQQLEREIQNYDIDVWDKKSIKPVLKEILYTISPEGIYFDEDYPKNLDLSIPVITYSPVFFLRKKSSRIWLNELTDVIQKIRDNNPIPETIKLLATDDIDEIIKSRDSDEIKEDWQSIGEELLFPLPTNAEQKYIAQKLAENPAVVVQGPPGTGKSHTIANLICHLLAHGKKVLVTSEKERPLRVLRDMIPHGIRDLCVSILGADSSSVKNIEDSIKNITENLDSQDPCQLKYDIEHLKDKLNHVKKKKLTYKNMINRAIELENQKVVIGNHEMSPLEMAKWLKANTDHNWLPDSIEKNHECPLTQNEMVNLFELAKALDKQDVEDLQKTRPEVLELPPLSVFFKNVKAAYELKKQIDENVEYIEGWNVSTISYAEVSIYKHEILDIIYELKRLDEKWIHNVIEDSIYSQDRRELWADFISESRKSIKQIQSLERELIEHEIVLPEGINPVLAEEDLLELKEKVNEDSKIGWLFKNVTGRKYSYLVDCITVDNLPIRDLDDIELVIKHIEKDELKRKLVLKWNRMMDGINGPQLTFYLQRFTFYVEELLDKLQSAQNWPDKVVKPLLKIMAKLGIQGEPEWTKAEWFQAIYKGLEVLGFKESLECNNKFFNELEATLIKGKLLDNAHISWTKLLNACMSKNIKAWSEEYLELVRLKGLESKYKVYINLRDKLAKVAPKWAGIIDAQGMAGKPLQLPSDWEIAWQWSRVNNYLNALQSKTNIEKYYGLLKGEIKKEAKLIQKLVVKSTWLAQINRTTEKERRSLFAWLKAVQRIGKGTGKYANMYRKEASSEFKICKGAIPVWIMPIQKVIENIELTEDLFDVIIVDESSQSDLFSLCALLRAKKAVIVGDENQISPESVGTDIGEIHQLIYRYLDGIPQGARFEMKTSLYDMANQVFDSKIVLKEHFRCVPEIIQFSNELMYEGKIMPLRVPISEEIIEPPVCEVFVQEGHRDENTVKVINRPEAEAVVNYIVKCCSSPKYSGKSMGVISLQGLDQAKLIEEQLREAIGEEEMINRKLICGDAYFFQGDERDVIFLSMVAAPNMRIGSLTKMSDYQRFNVAASRARDQMILFHSVKLSDLNPECARYRLLQYCQNPFSSRKEVVNIEEMFESQFEADVYKIISARGYKVIPKVKIGNTENTIDMVIEGNRSRLAVECDGDIWHGLDVWEKDIQRQHILERAGWVFWRVRGSLFYQNPEKAMNSLWVKLEEVGIKPTCNKFREVRLFSV